MSKTVLLDHFNLMVNAPTELGKAEYQAMLRTLRSRRFLAKLHQGVHEVVRRHPSLKKARFTIDR